MYVSSKLTMIPTELFHYTASHIAIEKILLSQQIKIGLIKHVNDPRESKDWALLPKITAMQTDSSFEKQYIVNKEFTKIKQEEWKVVCFSLNAPRYKRHPESKVDEGFLYGACKPRMWAHYGENHKGVCLKFNGLKFDTQLRNTVDGVDKNRKIFCDKVKYVDFGDTLDSSSIDYTELSEIGITKGLRKHLVKFHKQFFLSKARDWETESEFRWLVYSESKEFELLPIKGIIEEVIVGFDFPRVYYPTLFELCELLDIHVREIIWTNGYPIVSDYIQ